MRILFDVEYVFQNEFTSKIYLMKCSLLSAIEDSNGGVKLNTQNYICVGKNWKKVSVNDFNKLGLLLVGEV